MSVSRNERHDRDPFLPWPPYPSEPSPPSLGPLPRCPDFHRRRLWHQLTDKLEELCADPALTSHLIPLYTNFIHTFAAKLNQLRLAQLSVTIAAQHPTPNDSIAFLTSVQEKIREHREPSLDAQPLLFLKMCIAQMHLQAGNPILCRNLVREGQVCTSP